MSVDNTLAERGARYGRFADHAKIAQGIQDVMRQAESWLTLDHDMKQALTVIADKIARILNGDPFYADNWHDIQGYAKLVEDRINAKPDNHQELYDPKEVATALQTDQIVKPVPLPVSIEPWIKEGLSYRDWLAKKEPGRKLLSQTVVATEGGTVINAKDFDIKDVLVRVRDAARSAGVV